jgi:hypothetical protein
MGTFYGRHSRHSFGTLIFVNFSSVFLPHKNMFLADPEQVRKIALLYDMTSFKGRAFEIRVHFRNVMAQFHTNRILDFYLFHVSSFDNR